MASYRSAVFTSPTWRARRRSTGEYLEYTPQDNGREWTYTFPAYAHQEHFVTLHTWADTYILEALALDWEPLQDAPKDGELVPLTRRFA